MKIAQLHSNHQLLCPRCSRELDGFTGEAQIPTDGDISICLYCALILKFEGRGMNIKIRKITVEELAELKKDHANTWADLMRYRKMILSMINEHRQ